MSWQDILKLDVGIYNKCCDEAKQKYLELGYDPELANLDCMDFRRVCEVLMGASAKPILDLWDKCLEDNNEPPMDTDIDNTGNLEEMYEEIKELGIKDRLQ